MTYLASLSQKEYFPSEPTVAKVPWMGWNAMSFTFKQKNITWCFIYNEKSYYLSQNQYCTLKLCRPYHKHSGLYKNKSSAYCKYVLYSRWCAIWPVTFECEVIFGISCLYILNSYSSFDASKGETGWLILLIIKDWNTPMLQTDTLSLNK